MQRRAALLLGTGLLARPALAQARFQQFGVGGMHLQPQRAGPAAAGEISLELHGGASVAGLLREPAAENPLRQVAAPFDPGPLRRS